MEKEMGRTFLVYSPRNSPLKIQLGTIDWIVLPQTVELVFRIAFYLLRDEDLS